MSFGELIGYVASVLVFATFYVRTMMPLRMIAVASNIAFIIYAFSENLIPVFILHTLLLPINIARLYEIKTLVDLTRTGPDEDTSIDAIIPFMTQQKLGQGEVLFNKGDYSSHMYYVLEGAIRLREIDKVMGQGAIVGEVGLFSPYRQRTATAVAETECRLLSIDDKTLYQAYYQNPKLGFYLIRLISRRFAESYLGPKTSRAEKGTPVAVPEPVKITSAGQNAGVAPNIELASSAPGRASRLPAYLFMIFCLALAVVLSAGWYLHPYVGSALNRDAAVTAWSYPAKAPVEGQIVSTPPNVDTVVSGDVYLEIENTLVREQPARQADAEVAGLERNITSLENHLAALGAIRDQFGERLEGHKQLLDQMIEREIKALGDVIKALDEQIELERKSQRRQVALGSVGFSSDADVETAAMRLLALEQHRSEKTKLLVQLKSRKDALARGLPVDGEGDELTWANNDFDALELEIEKAKLELARIQSALGRAQRVRKATLDDVQKIQQARVKIPTGARIWRSAVRLGQFVSKGETLVVWIDCTDLMIDVPVSDTEAALLTVGSVARVVIDGETQPRHGQVAMVRGAAARLDKPDLAASAKGHSAMTGQVIVSIPARDADMRDCPVGKAAWADFPKITVLDLLRARLSAIDYL